MTDLRGMVGLVTGASSGLGRGLATMLAAQGVQVALAARRVDELQQVADAIRSHDGTALVVPTDMRNDDALVTLVTRTQQELGPIDILVNNAGVISTEPVHELNMAQWDLVMAVNLRAPAMLTATILPSMRERRRGYIVNIASEAGVFIYSGMGAYAVSKHALRVLTELTQQENQHLGIKAWAICPGMVDTPMGAAMPGGNRAAFLSVDEVVDVVRYLLLQDANVQMGPEILIRTMRNPFEHP
jgi:NAD(P)-dependent dehydrogenase (short-subunit alcohol dehydrogenase family)